jgi:aminoglycoside phosphotransferase (APT) family kinase protein
LLIIIVGLTVNNVCYYWQKTFIDRGINMLNNIISRGRNIDSFIKREELKSIKELTMEMIPGDIMHFTGGIEEISYPPQGMCSLVAALKSSSHKYILKVAKGKYRGRELYAEYCAMKDLISTSIPVPQVHIFLEENDLYFLLRDYTEGVQLSTLFNECKEDSIRMHMIDKMAELLSEIHKIEIGNCDYNYFIDSQLFFAEQHFKKHYN